MSSAESFEQRSLHAGIVGETLQPVSRKVPATEPPEWPTNAELQVVGKNAPRMDALEKVTGRARYTFDVQLPGMLYTRVINSTVPHARIKSIDTSRAEQYPGVRAVHVLERLLMAAELRDSSAEADERYPLVRFNGQPIAAVAATSARAAEAAARLVRIEYEPLPHVTELEDAMQPDAPAVFPGPTEQSASAGGGGAPRGLPQKGNLRGPSKGGSRGEIERGFREADVIVEGEYRTQVQTHTPLETHGIVADWRDDELTLYSSTQHVFSVREEAAEVFKLPEEKIRVVSDYTGGGFGAKYGIGNYGTLAIHLSRKARAPVRMVLDRREEHVSVGNRPSSLQRLKIGARSDGTLTAIQLRSFGTGGVAAGAGVGSCQHSMYPCPNVSIEHYDVFTNAGPCAAFRGPGQAQGIFAFEQAIDALAARLQMDPVALRNKIDTRDADDVRARAAERRIGAEKFGWSKRRAPGSDPGPIKHGLGMAQSMWPYIVNSYTTCELRISGSGSVDAFCGTQDIGTGTRTVFAQVVAEELGLQPEEITVHVGDTRFPPGPPSGGSRVTSSLTPAARNAAYAAARDIANRVAPLLDVKAEELVFRGGRIEKRDDPATSLAFAEALQRAGIETLVHRADRRDDYAGYARKSGELNISPHAIGGVQFAEVSVDTETGVVKVERVLAVHDCGRPINPKLVESQILGGVIQGVSYALYEDRRLDAATGVQLNANIDQYKMVGARETPAIEVHLIELLGGQSSTDARGVAEPANVATAAAVANAFFNATGKRIYTLPMTPANVLAALRSE
ncbi:xanthine dehydrogenase family protein molybdopterin-binding subunit [Steroidobacter sp. S1-65]|uniref:Xanthine dehydrogenase family protein molybdopterin-binding subunit n=1 Tax=Steroidobacter gossypii TaxID=2805490 RepID=A0ABS1X3W3_9GAMM|nr:xanthine dehydrogenase family protein molybdopterin-binding subunit [Steroidobacter gossypii]MBM0107914.1 xanthine dehydrogenase family protein molybdopterin-binding subunit [Steroidobacter gossypii]